MVPVSMREKLRFTIKPLKGPYSLGVLPFLVDGAADDVPSLARFPVRDMMAQATVAPNKHNNDMATY